MDLTLVVALAVLLVVVVGAVVYFRRGAPSLPPPPPTLPPEREHEARPLAAPPAEAPAAAPAPSAAPAATPSPTRPAPAEPEGFFARLKAGLSKTQQQLIARLDEVLSGKKVIDDALFEELEGVLLTADLGIHTTTRLLEAVRAEAARTELKDPQALRGRLRGEMEKILSRHDTSLNVPAEGPFVIMVVGVNGVGKTTTIGKLATHFRRQGKSVLLAAGDTYRAAAIEQLEVWGQRAEVPVVRRDEGSDPSSVIFDALERAKREGTDVVIADTAGRLHTKTNLMDELRKVHRVMGKVIPGAPHECLLVLDSTTGQNAVVQARAFNEGVHLTGIALTKLDGTAKGGVILGITDELDVPVKLIGIGEKVDDLRPFEPDQFVSALF